MSFRSAFFLFIIATSLWAMMAERPFLYSRGLHGHYAIWQNRGQPTRSNSLGVTLCWLAFSYCGSVRLFREHKRCDNPGRWPREREVAHSPDSNIDCGWSRSGSRQREWLLSRTRAVDLSVTSGFTGKDRCRLCSPCWSFVFASGIQLAPTIGVNELVLRNEPPKKTTRKYLSGL